MPRILIIIAGDAVAYICDTDVDVEVFDFDAPDEIPPPHFKDLCEEMGVPFVEMVQ